MTVVLFNKKAETYEHFHDVLFIKQEQEAMSFNGNKFRYIWHIRIKNSVYEHHRSCAQYTIHTIIA
jgi:hypothetical protein